VEVSGCCSFIEEKNIPLTPFKGGIEEKNIPLTPFKGGIERHDPLAIFPP